MGFWIALLALGRLGLRFAVVAEVLMGAAQDTIGDAAELH